MAKEKTEPANTGVAALTKTEARLMLGICSVLTMEPSDKKLVGKTASLKAVQELLKEVDVAKVSRKMHREELMTYSWNEDRTRNIGITEEGFKSLQLPPKEKKVPAPKEKAESTEAGENKVKPAKAKTKEPAAPALDAAEEMPEVASNVLMKKVVVSYKGKTLEFKAKDTAGFNLLKNRKAAEWIPEFSK